jgi:hypothetical protein
VLMLDLIALYDLFDPITRNLSYEEKPAAGETSQSIYCGL